MNFNGQHFKRPTTLNLNNPNEKRPCLYETLTAPVLSTPDMVLLQVASPELENMIRNSGSLPVLTPNLFPSRVSNIFLFFQS